MLTSETVFTGPIIKNTFPWKIWFPGGQTSTHSFSPHKLASYPKMLEYDDFGIETKHRISYMLNLFDHDYTNGIVFFGFFVTLYGGFMVVRRTTRRKPVG